MKNRKAVILVAGMGTRLKPLTLENHKCLTKVNGSEILINALDNLQQTGISQVVLVVGYLADKIRSTIGDKYKDIAVSYVENTLFEKTNTSYSLQLGIGKVEDYDELFVLEGDVFFSKRLFDRLTYDEHSSATLLEIYRSDLDGTFVELNSEGFVIDWTHKSMREEGYTLEDKYKTINIHKFDKRFVEKVLIPCTNAICAEGQGKQPMENILRQIVRLNNRAVFGVLSGGEKWFEIDDQNDLKIAEKIFSEE